MTLSNEIYNKILFQERIANYKLYDEYWYVVKWNDQTFIHFTIKRISNSRRFLWYLAASTFAPKFRCQTQEFTMWSTIDNSQPALQAGK